MGLVGAGGYHDLMSVFWAIYSGWWKWNVVAVGHVSCWACQLVARILTSSSVDACVILYNIPINCIVIDSLELLVVCA